MQLDEKKVLETNTMKLDEDKMKVLNISLQFAKDTVKAIKSPVQASEAPKLIVTGGAGAGKSTLINVVSQWMHRYCNNQEMTLPPLMY